MADRAVSRIKVYTGGQIVIARLQGIAEPFGATLDGRLERRVGGPLLELAGLAVGVRWKDARLDGDESGDH